VENQKQKVEIDVQNVTEYTCGIGSRRIHIQSSNECEERDGDVNITSFILRKNRGVVLEEF
jgi:hypothetical protein